MEAVIATIVLGAFCALLARWGQTQAREFAEQFPPISDAEFVACCRPGVKPQVALKVREIIARKLGVSYEHLHPSMRFLEDIGVQ